MPCPVPILPANYQELSLVRVPLKVILVPGLGFSADFKILLDLFLYRQFLDQQLLAGRFAFTWSKLH